MPHRGTGRDLWYTIEPTDDPDVRFVTFPVDIPECWEEEVYIQVVKEIGPFEIDYAVPQTCPSSVQILCRMRTN